MLMIAAAVLILGSAGTVILDQLTEAEPETVATLQTPGMGTINVTVVDNAGRAIVNATVTLNGTPFSNLTLSDGRILIEDLPPNATDEPYELYASKGGYLDSLTSIVELGADETKNITLMIRGGLIYGTVTSATGPVMGAKVSIVETELDMQYESNVSDVTGVYNINGLPSGTRNVTVTAQGYATVNSSVFMPLAGVVEAHFVLVAIGGFISGHTYHASLHTPLAGTNVSIEIGGTTVTVKSDSEGNYDFDEAQIPGGVYTITASRDGFYPANVTGVVVTSGERTEGVDLNLTERPTSLYGVVRSGQVLLVGANVSIAGTGIYALSGADGNYMIENLTAGTYTATSSVQGYETLVITNVTVLPGSALQLNFNMTGLPGATLRGIVKDSRYNSPLAGVLVTVIDLEPQPRSVFTNINGEFEFPALPSGNYTLRFEKTGFRPLEIGELEASEGSDGMIEFQMTPLRESFEGFFEGLDLAHSMMVLGLALTLTILGVAIVLRIKAIVSPATAPGVYDQAEEEEAGAAEGTDLEEDLDPVPEDTGEDPKNKKVRKLK